MARKHKEKSKLEKLVSSPTKKPYVTTERACRIWFSILNDELFDGTLSPISEIDIRWRRKVHAFYECTTYSDRPDYLYSKLGMNKRYHSKRFFVEILAHEMIHHWQKLNNEPLGHGPSFSMWNDTFARKGLALDKAYNGQGK